MRAVATATLRPLPYGRGSVKKPRALTPMPQALMRAPRAPKGMLPRSCGAVLPAQNRDRKGADSRARRRGQALTEFAVIYAAVILPLTFMTIFVAEAVWIWHGMTEWTRDGARYAATHCYDGDAVNRVVDYMRTHVPPVVDRAQFQAGGSATVLVQYGTPACDDCIPDTVTVSVGDYTFGRLAGFLRLPGIPLPSFATNLPMESAGYTDGSGGCTQL